MKLRLYALCFIISSVGFSLDILKYHFGNQIFGSTLVIHADGTYVLEERTDPLTKHESEGRLDQGKLVSLLEWIQQVKTGKLIVSPPEPSAFGGQYGKLEVLSGEEDFVVFERDFDLHLWRRNDSPVARNISALVADLVLVFPSSELPRLAAVEPPGRVLVRYQWQSAVQQVELTIDDTGCVESWLRTEAGAEPLYKRSRMGRAQLDQLISAITLSIPIALVQEPSPVPMGRGVGQLVISKGDVSYILFQLHGEERKRIRNSSSSAKVVARIVSQFVALPEWIYTCATLVSD